MDLAIKHKNVICQPLIESANIEKHLRSVELVVVGGESDKNARPLDFNGVLDIQEQCKRQDVHFDFRQCGTCFIKDEKRYKPSVKDLWTQAKRANINL